ASAPAAASAADPSGVRSAASWSMSTHPFSRPALPPRPGGATGPGRGRSWAVGRDAPGGRLALSLTEC
ncbi:hypothetical protein AB0I41_26870, partial [Micromonospora sp. NPDC050200]